MTFLLAIEHANATRYSAVDGTATKRMHAIMVNKHWTGATLTSVDYGKYEAAVDRTVSIYHYEVPS